MTLKTGKALTHDINAFKTASYYTALTTDIPLYHRILVHFAHDTIVILYILLHNRAEYTINNLCVIDQGLNFVLGRLTPGSHGLCQVLVQLCEKVFEFAGLFGKGWRGYNCEKMGKLKSLEGFVVGRSGRVEELKG
jgi:hypothetical protein